MEFILIFLVAALFLFLAAAIIGVIRPNLVKQKTKSRALISNFIPAIAILILIGIFSPDQEQSKSIETSSNKSSEESKLQSNSSSKAKENIELVESSLEKNYGIDLEFSFGEKYCFNENYCEAMAGKVKVQTMGVIAEAIPSSQESPAFYQSICSAIFMALSGANKELSEQMVTQTFNSAAKNGHAKASVAGVDISVETSSDSLLSCKYVKP